MSRTGLNDKPIYSSKVKMNTNSISDETSKVLMEQYKMFVEMSDRVSTRRLNTNIFFLTLNTALLGLLGKTDQFVIFVTEESKVLLIPIIGMLISCIWYGMIMSSKDLNKAKFKIIHKMEEQLPEAPFKEEWQILEGGDSKNYTPATSLEIYIPWIFLFLYIAISICSCLIWK